MPDPSPWWYLFIIFPSPSLFSFRNPGPGRPYMTCLSCLPSPHTSRTTSAIPLRHHPPSDEEEEEDEEIGRPQQAAVSFTFREMAMATGNFREANVIGEGGFGKVYKGRMERTGEIVAVKQLNVDGFQGFQEFIVEVLMLSLLRHPNLVRLIGYCTDGDQRLLAYEYMSGRSLEHHLFCVKGEGGGLDWKTRMKIAVGAAQGLEHLHCKADPPVIYRDLKSANILLDDEFNAKLSDFGLAKLGPVGDNTHVSTRVMGTYGYCAPEYAMSGKLTLKSDIYSFGVVLLELITGRKAFDHHRSSEEKNLVLWAKPYMRDRSRFVELGDELMKGGYPEKAMHHAIAIAAMCLQEQQSFRPIISDILVALHYLAAGCPPAAAASNSADQP